MSRYFSKQYVKISKLNPLEILQMTDKCIYYDF